MKKSFLTLVGLLAFSALSQAQTTIAQWTFETSLPAGTPGAGVWLTNIAAEVGTGTASGWHLGSATYSSPAGNGSPHSFSVAAWTNSGDLFQFAVSTLNLKDITLSWDQTSSTTGPRLFNLEYSTDGSTFTTFATDYIARTNVAAANNNGSGITTSGFWSSGTAQTGYSYSYDLSSETSLDNAANVYFRLVLDNLNNGLGNATPSTGTDRIDNFTISATPTPEPSISALSALGGLALLVLRRRK